GLGPVRLALRQLDRRHQRQHEVPGRLLPRLTGLEPEKVPCGVPFFLACADKNRNVCCRIWSARPTRPMVLPDKFGCFYHWHTFGSTCPGHTCLFTNGRRSKK